MSKLGSKTLLNQTTNQQQKDHEQHTTDRTDRQIDRRGKMIDKERETETDKGIFERDRKTQSCSTFVLALYTPHHLYIDISAL